MLIISTKRLKELLERACEAAKKEVRENRVLCLEGNHQPKIIYNLVRNSYQPQYFRGKAHGMYAMLSADEHDDKEREMMFDSIYIKTICERCGKILDEDK